jgi:manganese/zinc/iron transport system permease protein
MGLVSLTTVASFESVGAILVVAFLVVPPATAYLITTSMRYMILLSCLFGILASVFGYLLAFVIDGSIAGAMATIAGLNFAIVFFVNKQLINRKPTTEELKHELV